MTNRTVEHAHPRLRIPIVGLPCVAGDRMPLEKALTSVQGVADAYVNPADECVYLDVDAAHFSLEEARAVIERFGGRIVGSGARRK